MSRYHTPAKTYRMRYPPNYVIRLSTYVPEPNPYTDRRWARMKALRRRRRVTSVTPEEWGRMGQDIDWRWIGTKGY